jgi:GTP-binding protein HflX
MHAESREGKLQVELAKLEYVLPRLRGMWGHLEAERLGGGRGARFGAGESQLEVDRRLTRKRISDLRKELQTVSSARETQRKRRGRSGVYRVSLVGYTNAGKSTLLNAMTDANVLAQDMLFATLDSTTRRVQLPEGREITLTDTVGFIHKLPHGLVEAFKSTLDEVAEADLLLHVVDGWHPEAERQMIAVNEVLHEIGADSTPQLIVVNKTDIAAEEDLADLARRHPGAAFVSARRRRGLEELADMIGTEAAKGATTLTVLIPYTRGELVQLAHEHTHVVSERHEAEGTLLVVQATGDFAARLSEFQVEGEGAEGGG